MPVNQILDKHPTGIKGPVHEINIEIGENYPVKPSDSKEKPDTSPAPFWA